MAKEDKNNEKRNGIKIYLDAAKESGTSFARYVITLSAGAFVLSITFVKEFASDNFLLVNYLLFISWFLFWFSISAILISFFISQIGNMLGIKLLNKSIKKHDSDEKSQKLNKYNRWIIFLNFFSIAGFILGSLLLALFAVFVCKGGVCEMKKKEREEKVLLIPNVEDVNDNNQSNGNDNTQEDNKKEEK